MMRDLDAFCLIKVVALNGEDIEALRQREPISQASSPPTSMSAPN